MFKQPFSFEGRIRRTEFGLSFIIVFVYSFILQLVLAAMFISSRRSYYDNSNDSSIGLAFLIFFIPALWFSWAQGAKRCHDLGNSGWFQLIPFYGLWLLFADGQPHPNEYGDNPKGAYNQLNITSPPPGGGYQAGGYNGGHNNPGQNPYQQQQQGNSGEYNSGDLYR